MPPLRRCAVHRQQAAAGLHGHECPEACRYRHRPTCAERRPSRGHTAATHPDRGGVDQLRPLSEPCTVRTFPRSLETPATPCRWCWRPSTNRTICPARMASDRVARLTRHLTACSERSGLSASTGCSNLIYASIWNVIHTTPKLMKVARRDRIEKLIL